ncbi:hlyD secretion family protein [Neorickettsia helminthoeca str. Oregon]|uniref:HlyD secretion family protein n=1 Tax=Neorickettsia helminthoeca str. Oregon TaxID=1286528 RepID=X5HKV2_9RICK|nr:biotin carboxylase N-terminal domain-containing protein [Neorickettsia helminthoeca]AHX11704.1 hlyD secretion family protein [Neorickettsia helminthoeca str. Oregon]
MSIQKVLIANRGEIASRIIRTLRKLGKKSVAVYSDLDVGAEYVRHADEAVHIGGSTAKDSYNNMEALLSAITKTGADAVHPGYGFLSENPEFALCLEKHNIIFIGPSSDCISKMSNKVMAKKIAKEASVNLIPGYVGEVSDYTHALSIAKEIGFPVLIKASAGGGGKGMRLVHREEELRDAMNLACSEALSFFKDQRVFIEKYIKNPRHIEIQILADKQGNIICLGERECSIQRRHQKIIEEAPSIALHRALRKEMYNQSIRLAKSVNYTSAGTVEYILDQENNFYFMEMNTRIQVEHPVTEMITGIDIVEEMIRIAEGDALSKKTSITKFNGWSFEARVYAEDPMNNFMPTSGFVAKMDSPTNARVESSICAGSDVGMFYDPMVAKIIVHAKSRADAINEMCEALRRTCIVGLKNNLVFLESVFRHEDFISGNVDTHFVENQYQHLSWSDCLDHDATIKSMAVALYIARRIWGCSMGEEQDFVIRLGKHVYEVRVTYNSGELNFMFAGVSYLVEWQQDVREGLFLAELNKEAFIVRIINTDKFQKRVEYKGFSILCAAFPATVYAKYSLAQDNAVDVLQSEQVSATMTGMIANVYVAAGDIVKQGDPLCVIEAMKMQNTITSERGGTVEKVYVEKGQNISEGDPLLKFSKV